MKELIYGRLLLPALEHHAGRTAIHDGDYRATYAEHGRRALRLADAIRHQLGLARGEAFAVMSANRHEYAELYHAAYLGAGVIVPVNLRLSPVELRHVISHSGARALFVDDLVGPMLLRALEEAGMAPPGPVVLMGDGDVAHDVRYEDLVDAGRETLLPEPEEDDETLIMYTGGTTGLPKGASSDQRAAVLNLYRCGVRGRTGYTPGAVYLHHIPLFHISGMTSLLTTTVMGEESVILTGFEPGQAIEVIERHGVNELAMVPTMIAMVLDHPSFRPERLASIRRLGYGAAPMPAALLDRMRAALPGVELTQGYGMTECAVLTILDPEDHHREPYLLRSVGRALPGIELAILDAEGQPCPAGVDGEICVRTGSVMRGYHDDPEATAEAFRGGWFHTGDAGRLDADGYLYLADRLKDMIITGGENVFSLEVEDAVGSHPAVAQVAVIGVPHDLWGEQVHAVVVLRPEAEVTEDELREHARTRIAGYKVPKSMELTREPLPLSAAGKILKRELRSRWAAEQEG